MGIEPMSEATIPQNCCWFGCPCSPVIPPFVHFQPGFCAQIHPCTKAGLSWSCPAATKEPAGVASRRSSRPN